MHLSLAYIINHKVINCEMLSGQEKSESEEIERYMVVKFSLNIFLWLAGAFRMVGIRGSVIALFCGVPII